MRKLDSEGSNTSTGVQSPPRPPKESRAKIRFSLATKFNIYFVSLLCVTVVGVGGWLSWQVDIWEREALARRGFELAEMFASGMPVALYDRDGETLDAIVARLANHPERCHPSSNDSEQKEACLPLSPPADQK